ncbi:MAG: GNAT family N-acetyltransferase [Rhodocyclaceae bacterium]|nr:GNAT family N-acetyltransferase [Rhodocyclaceae bacterium]
MLQTPIAHPVPPTETLFASRAWLDYWLAAFGGQESGYWPLQSIANCPQIAYIVQHKIIGPLSLRVATAAANSHTPRFDVTGQIMPTTRQLQQMMKDLNVSALIFPYLSSSSKLMVSVETGKKLFHWSRGFCEDAPFINCSASWHDYLESRGSTRQTSWKKYERRIQRNGGTFEVLASWEDISPCITEVFQIEESGWKGHMGSSIAQDVTTRRFYEDVCEYLAKVGKLRLFIIRRNDRIVAFQLATLHAGILSGLKASYLDEFAKESPGQVLQFWITQWAFGEDDVQTYDLLGPSSEYKLRFSTGIERLETLYAFAPNIGGFIARLRWSVAPHMKHQLRKIAKRTFGAQ